MLIGEFRHQVDGKGRVALPAQFRRGLPSGSIVAIGPEGRLVIRPPDAWAALERDHQMSAETPHQARAYLRALYSSARELETDAQGRMLLIEAHREWASISDRAVFIGLGSVVEIVGEAVWDGERSGLDQVAFTTLNDNVMNRAGVPALTAPPA